MIYLIYSGQASDNVYLSYFDLSYIQWASDSLYLSYFDLSYIQWAGIRYCISILL